MKELLRNKTEVAKEKEPDFLNIVVFAATGMADVNTRLNEMMSHLLKADVIESYWFDPNDTLDMKFARIHEIAEKAHKDGKKLVGIGISAGALLLEAHDKEYPDDIDYVLSLSGLLDPVSHPRDMEKFRITSLNLRDVLKFIKNRSTLKNLSSFRKKVTSFSSPEDQLVPMKISKPFWGIPENQHIVHGDHTGSILWAAIFEIQKHLKLIDNSLNQVK